MQWRRSSFCSRNIAIISSFWACSFGRMDMMSFGGAFAGRLSIICSMCLAIHRLTAAAGRGRNSRDKDRKAITPPNVTTPRAISLFIGSPFRIHPDWRPGLLRGIDPYQARRSDDSGEGRAAAWTLSFVDLAQLAAASHLVRQQTRLRPNRDTQREVRRVA